jgi:FMN phosphatase YigB (HAD superfamily)
MSLNKITLLLFTSLFFQSFPMEHTPNNTVIAFDYHDVLSQRNLSSTISQAAALVKRSPRTLALLLNVYFLYDIVFGDSQKCAQERITYLVNRYSLMRPHKEAFFTIAHDLKPVPGMHELAQELHDQGYTLYLASNIGTPDLAAQQERYPELFALFTDCYTPETAGGVKKPKAAYYEGLRKLINEREAGQPHIIFIDDSKNNVTGAVMSNQNISGFQFKNAQQLKADLQKAGVSVSFAPELKVTL